MPPLLRASELDGLQPIDDPASLLGERAVWFARTRYAAWSAGPSFIGWVLWGHFSTDEAESGKQLWIALAARIRPPYDFVLDLRRLESISSGAYRRIREFANTAKPGLRKMAILVGEDTPGGMIQVGLFALRPPTYPWRSFTTSRDAATWLATSNALPALDAVEHLAGVWPDESSSLVLVRALLVQQPGATMAEIARRLGESPRSLQRHLAEQGTSFSIERDGARVAHAQELLMDPEIKLDAVAAAIGCSDRRTLNRLFRRITGKTPAQYRAGVIVDDGG